MGVEGLGGGFCSPKTNDYMDQFLQDGQRSSVRQLFQKTRKYLVSSLFAQRKTSDGKLIKGGVCIGVYIYSSQ